MNWNQTQKDILFNKRISNIIMDKIQRFKWARDKEISNSLNSILKNKRNHKKTNIA
jgi:hypothetical protein